MANKQQSVFVEELEVGHAPALAGLYALVSIATVAALVVLSIVQPELATPHAWGHAVIVAAVAVLLPLRLRAAWRGSGRALRASLVIAVVILVVNVVEAALPGVFTAWMRIDMVVSAAIMLLLVIVLVRARR